MLFRTLKVRPLSISPMFLDSSEEVLKLLLVFRVFLCTSKKVPQVFRLVNPRTVWTLERSVCLLRLCLQFLVPLEDAVNLLVQVLVVVDDGGLVQAGSQVVVVDILLASFLRLKSDPQPASILKICAQFLQSHPKTPVFS